MQPEDNIVPKISDMIQNDTDKKIEEMAKEAYLMRREIAIIAALFFLAFFSVVLFAIGSMTQVHLPI